jgi:hypothetical protein
MNRKEDDTFYAVIGNGHSPSPLSASTIHEDKLPSRFLSHSSLCVAGRCIAYICQQRAGDRAQTQRLQGSIFFSYSCSLVTLVMHIGPLTIIFCCRLIRLQSLLSRNYHRIVLTFLLIFLNLSRAGSNVGSACQCNLSGEVSESQTRR